MTINWDVFYIFTIVSVILWIISSVTSAMKNGISKTAVAARKTVSQKQPLQQACQAASFF